MRNTTSITGQIGSPQDAYSRTGDCVTRGRRQRRAGI